jgi:hypothetical protein
VLLERDADVFVIDSGSGRGTFLAGQAVQEALLRDGDVIELGEGGPRLRFERDSAHAATIRTRRTGRRLTDTMAFQLVQHSSRLFRRALGALAVLALACLGLVGWSWWESRRLRGEVATLRHAVLRAEADRRSLAARVEDERRRADAEREVLQQRLAEFHSHEEELRRRLAEAASAEAQAVKDELVLTRTRINTLEAERAAGENVIRRYGSGVCLIQGSFAYHGADGRLLRVQNGDSGGLLAPRDGDTVLTLEGDGPVHTVDYYGTGFLVDGRGLVLTNRHLAEPWWNDSGAEAMQKAGYRPGITRLRVFFPSQKQPFDAHVERRSEKVDLALLRVNLRGSRIPTLPLDRSKRGAVAGQPVVVLGYPAGLEAILAKTDSNVVKQVLDSYGTKPDRVTEALSLQGLIRPSATQGHIGDVTASDIVYDASTTQGGSGGPVFNKRGEVVAVEYAVLPKFGGNSFGVPIAYALELLEPPGKPRG